MESPRTLILARVSELLRTIESSSEILRTFLEKEERNDVKQGESTDPAVQLTENLGLPFHSNLRVVEEASVLRVACERLARLVTAPRHLIFESAGAYLTTMGLEVALKYDIATRIHAMSKKESREGVPIESLSRESGLGVDELGRVLRYLSVRGIFQEIEPGVFDNTTASSMLVNNPEFVAHLNVIMQDVRRGAPYYEQFMKRRFEDSTSGRATPAPFTLSSGGVPWYSWLHSKEHADRGKLFDQAMRGMTITEGLQFLPLDYPFDSYPPETLIVDVGGGIGSLAELILPSAPHLRYVVQDLESTINLARDIVTPAMRVWMAKGRLKFQAHDGFVRQPIEHEGAVFILKTVIHNWSDNKAVELLRTLRKSKPSKVLVIDRLVRPHLRTEAQSEEGEAEIYRPLCEEDKRQGDFSSQGVPTEYDLIMSITHGSKTRLCEEWTSLFTSAGFKVSGIYPLRASTGQAVLEAIPTDDEGMENHRI